MKRILFIITFYFTTTICTADTIATNQKLKFLEQTVKQVETNQLNYKIEKDLLKETYSNNYERINLLITIIFGVVGFFGFIGLRDINSIKKEYKEELSKLRLIKGEFDLKSKEFDTDKKKVEEEIKSIIKENEEQSRKIKFLELKEKVRSLIKDKSHSLALEFANAALDISPKDTDILNQKGLILCRLNQMKEAVETFSSALEINPNDSTTICNTVECMFFAKEIDAAKKLIEKNKVVFNNKDEGKLFELFNLVEIFFQNDTEKLIDIAKSLVTVENVNLKLKKYASWDLQEAQHFIYFQPENLNKTILKNIFWFWDAQIDGKTLLTRLGIELPTAIILNEAEESI